MVDNHTRRLSNWDQLLTSRNIEVVKNTLPCLRFNKNSLCSSKWFVCGLILVSFGVLHSRLLTGQTEKDAGRSEAADGSIEAIGQASRQSPEGGRQNALKEKAQDRSTRIEDPRRAPNELRPVLSVQHTTGTAVPRPDRYELYQL